MDLITARDVGVTEFEALYARERPGMLRLAYLMVGSAEAGEDLVHDAFIEVHRRFSSLDQPGAYLRRAVVNRCLTWRGRAAMERQRLQLVAARPPVAAVDEPVSLWDALNGLTAQQRVAVVLTYYGDLTSDQAAEVMGCRPATVRSLVKRGLEALRKVVEL